MEADKSRRYRTADEVLAELEAIAAEVGANRGAPSPTGSAPTGSDLAGPASST